MRSRIVAARVTPETQIPVVEDRWPSALIWRHGEPAVCAIGLEDIKDALTKGIEDFKAMPSHIAFLILIYPIAGLLLGRFMISRDLLHLAYPVVSGFVLLGAAASVGLYEMSRRRELGEAASPANALDVLKSPSIGAIVWLMMVMAGLFVAWLWIADAMFTSLVGRTLPATAADFVHEVITTPGGHQLMLVGNLVGALFAIVALMISVFSFPMLVDRTVGVGVAVRTSVRAVLESPVTMALWGVLIVLALLVGALPLLMGLAVVLPVLGHATWHLYRKAVSRTDTII